MIVGLKKIFNPTTVLFICLKTFLQIKLKKNYETLKELKIESFLILSQILAFLIIQKVD